MQSEIELVAGVGTAAAMLQPIRLRMLESFREPRSAAEVARLLDTPRQRLGHHVRALRECGLLRQVGERRTGNFVEQVLQTTSRCYVLAPQTLGGMAVPGEMRDRFSSEYLTAVAAAILDDMAWLRAAADKTGKKVATLTLETEINFASPSDQAGFAEELTNCLAGLTAKYHRGGKGRRFRFAVAGYPARSRRGGEPTAAAGKAQDQFGRKR